MGVSGGMRRVRWMAKEGPTPVTQRGGATVGHSVLTLLRKVASSIYFRSQKRERQKER